MNVEIEDKQRDLCQERISTQFVDGKVVIKGNIFLLNKTAIEKNKIGISRVKNKLIC